MGSQNARLSSSVALARPRIGHRGEDYGSQKCPSECIHFGHLDNLSCRYIFNIVSLPVVSVYAYLITTEERISSKVMAIENVCVRVMVNFMGSRMPRQLIKSFWVLSVRVSQEEISI